MPGLSRIEKLKARQQQERPVKHKEKLLLNEKFQTDNVENKLIIVAHSNYSFENNLLYQTVNDEDIKSAYKDKINPEELINRLTEDFGDRLNNIHSFIIVAC